MLVRTLVLTGIVSLFASSAAAQGEHAVDEQHRQPAGRVAAVTSATDETKEQSEERRVGPHGGALQQIGNLQVESRVEPNGIRLFVYNQQGEPIDLRAARGLATVHVRGNAKRYRYDLFPEIGKDQSAEALTVAVDLRRMAGQAIEIQFRLAGVPGAGRRPARFIASSVVPMTEQQRIAAAIAAQRVCPVSGQPLNSMGGPIPVTIGEQVVYVCCAACIDTVKANPSKYLAKLAPPQPSQRTVEKATAADARFVAAQQLCPVMDEPLDAMGGPYKTIIAGRIVYLCCPGCAKKLQAAPAVYLAKLRKQGVEPPRVHVN